MNWYLEVLKKYAVFNGRARRKEYWYFVSINFIIYCVLMAIGTATGAYSQETSAVPTAGTQMLSGLIGVFTLVLFIPNLAVSVRRLHDTDRSGWWLLIGIVPFIGLVVLLIFMVLDSTPGTNRFGPYPKGAIN